MNELFVWRYYADEVSLRSNETETAVHGLLQFLISLRKKK